MSRPPPVRAPVATPHPPRGPADVPPPGAADRFRRLLGAPRPPRPEHDARGAPAGGGADGVHAPDLPPDDGAPADPLAAAWPSDADDRHGDADDHAPPDPLPDPLPAADPPPMDSPAPVSPHEPAHEPSEPARPPPTPAEHGPRFVLRGGAPAHAEASAGSAAAVQPPPAWLQDTAQFVLSLCAHHDAVFDTWHLTVPLDATHLPDSELRLSLTPAVLQLSFRTGCAASARQLSSHRAQLHALLAGGASREVEIDWS